MQGSNLFVWISISQTVMEMYAESTTTATAVSAALDSDQSVALAAKALRVLSMGTVLLATIASRTAWLIRRENATTGATMIHAGLMVSVTAGAIAVGCSEQKVSFRELDALELLLQCYDHTECTA